MIKIAFITNSTSCELMRLSISVLSSQETVDVEFAQKL